MASYFVAQLKDMFFGLVDRVTGYGWSESQDGAGAQDEPTKLASAEVSPTEEEVTVVQNIQIRPRSSADPFVSGGTKPQVN
ncbi:hypothetical protein SETIT_7G257300v2 [Setaria italica]|uniref:Uncharacterized protein n=1 Tax=Setaria italica TaxID=4555 RepID=K3YBB0_SETIT|nr:uncharacterized protein LOC101785998 isoform X1 [Setaria italica]RCV35660.1 hypothetical protein SETIT_7G257300v2 [Setaria italica]